MEKQKKKNAVAVRGKKMYLIVAAAVILVLVLIILLMGNSEKDDKKEIITESTLEKIIDVSDLSTYEAVYNGIAPVSNKKDGKKTDYYVSYEAKVKAGIDFKQVKIAVDEKKKKISISVPEVEITDTNVDITTLDFIFENKKAETETVTQEAYKAAIEDVKKEIIDKDALYTLAADNAKNVIEALVKPFVKQLDDEYALEIK